VLDLGASPGGWSRIARLHGLAVVAVDPAALAGQLATDTGVRYIQEIAQNYLRETNETFAVILNDMRMDAQVSAQLMVEAARNLQAGGWALLTLKLPKHGANEAVTAALARLGQVYELIGARQLFHNRSEVTVALRPR
jgi:23S rRNA (cytidine2498-2'-O)-methyltransferase